MRIRLQALCLALLVALAAPLGAQQEARDPTLEPAGDGAVAEAGAAVADTIGLEAITAEADAAAATAERRDRLTTEEGLPDYAAWQATVERAQEAIENDRASDSAMEELRRQIVQWREVFEDATGVNAARIRTLQAQIDALGPLPESGEEPANIAARRAELNERMAALREPVIEAEEAFLLADGIIREIDSLLRDRQSERFFERGPSPLNPTSWKAGVDAVHRMFGPVWTEIQAAWAVETQANQIRRHLPETLFFLAMGLLLMVRGRRLMVRVALRVQGEDPTPARWILAFLVSLGQVLVPTFGIGLLVQAAYTTQLVGLHTDAALSSVASMGFAFYVATWLGANIFPKRGAGARFLILTPAQCAQGRWFASALGLTFGFYSLIVGMIQFQDIPAASKSGIAFPLIVFAAVLLLRVAQLMVVHARNVGAEGENMTVFNNPSYLFGRATMGLAAAGPVLAALGYYNAAVSIIFPTIASLALIGFIALIQRLFREAFALATGDKDRVQNALGPVIVNIFIILLSLPVFALTWGARWSDITELWKKFQDGYAFGGVKISPTELILFFVVFAIGYTVTRLVQSALRTTVLPRTKMDVGGQHAVVSAVGYVGLALSAVVAVTSAGIDLSAFALVAGALSVGIGFGLQTIVSNFVSGLILLAERPISEGDWIEVNGQMGYVRDISVRATRIETFDKTDVIVPNADLVSGVVTNWTRGNLTGRLILPVGVAYGSDTKRVEKVLLEIANAHPMVIANPAPSVLFRNFGADALEFEIRCFLRDVNWKLSVQSDMNHEIARRFAEEGFEIPFAQRDVWLRNPETLPGAARPAAPAGGQGGGQGVSAQPYPPTMQPSDVLRETPDLSKSVDESEPDAGSGEESS
ncbi:putative MscS family protein.1 precursor [Pseudoruegeria aquimaris]|uniref:Putative MscS family protein.1 n=1 Tax=Pseudoruegeria aquimaris TaxID=393663 RepID=A0A1Y5RRL5_9RHOB|nr:DUF3772 domain-containing protein [Pseudoruegeria aquimaris]SLN20886.1 putative MscS family protein.1 precursor [Pseudoruegeria aquimaris]